MNIKQIVYYHFVTFRCYHREWLLSTEIEYSFCPFYSKNILFTLETFPYKVVTHYFIVTCKDFTTTSFQICPSPKLSIDGLLMMVLFIQSRLIPMDQFSALEVMERYDTIVVVLERYYQNHFKSFITKMLNHVQLMRRKSSIHIYLWWSEQSLGLVAKCFIEKDQ